MTDKEKLAKVKAEIKRLMKDVEIHSDIGDIQQDSYYDGRRSVLCLIRDFINSLPEEPVSEEQVKESLISKHEDKTCKENGNSLTQEPVSDDLEAAAKHYLYSNILYDDVYVGNPTDKDCIEMFKAGANWQKQKDKSKVLTEEQCRKIRDDAFELGKDAMKQQLMAKAVDGKIYETQARSKLKAVTTGNLSLLDYKVGDKVKVIIIKED